MKNLKFLVAAAMVLASTTAFAQFANSGSGNNSSSSNDIVKGYDRMAISYNSYKLSPDDDDADDVSLNGIGAEWIHGFSLSSTTPLYLETGLKFMYGFKSEDDRDFWGDEEDCTLKTTMMNIAVPINLAYRITFSGNSDVSLTPFTGITLKGNLTAKQKCEYDFDDGDEEDDDEIDWFDKDDMGGSKYTAKRFQLGWQIGAGLSYKALYVGLSYGLDFSEFAKKVKTSNFAVTLGYNF